jgi:hypothetical protein
MALGYRTPWEAYAESQTGGARNENFSAQKILACGQTHSGN